MTRITGDWLTAQPTQAVMRLLEDGGYQAFAVGGCVRNALLGVPVTDVDISTDARPETIMHLAEAAGLRPVPTGIEHGTITIVADHQGFEVTTFRADVETDGRRAVVRHSDDIAEDARRRDFTMNALYADRHGRIVDPLGGLPDLRARRLRFIEDAETRIREDYLRILRFFRFSAFYADPHDGMDADALAAIAANLDGLDMLSRERVGSETVKLLSAPDPVMAVSVMARIGVLTHVLPGGHVALIGPLVSHETALGLDPDPFRRMAALGFFDGSALRLSKAQQKRLGLYQSLIGGPQSIPEIAYRHGAGIARDTIVLRAAAFEAPLDHAALRTVDTAAQALFPVMARDLPDSLEGAQIGAALRRLEERWIASGFALDKTALLDSLER